MNDPAGARRAFLWLGLLCLGCGQASEPPVFPVHVNDADRISPALLLSEIEQADKPAELLDADFLLENRSNSARQISLAGKSCSCYGVLIDQSPFAVQETITIPSASEKVLTFEVAPPAKPSEKSWLVRLASDGEPPQELRLSLRVHVYADVRLEPDVIVTQQPSVISDQPSTDSPQQQEHPLIIRHTWRGDVDDAAVLQFTGLPTGFRHSPPLEREASREVEDGLWQQSWETVISSQPSDTSDLPSTGIHRFNVSFVSASGETTSARGRLIVKEPPGITAPSVVHWGQIKVGVPRTRRIMLSASDQRLFTLNSAHLKDSPQRVALNDQPSAPISWHLKTSAAELTITLDANKPHARQSVEFELTPRESGPMNETVVFETDHPLTPTLELNLRAIVLEPAPSSREPVATKEPDIRPQGSR